MGNNVCVRRTPRLKGQSRTAGDRPESPYSKATKKAMEEADYRRISFGPMQLRVPKPHVIIACPSELCDNYQSAVSEGRKRKFNFDILTSTDHIESLKITTTPNLIIIDLSTSAREFRGIEIVRKLAKVKEFEDVLFLAVEANSPTESSQERAEISSVFTKVFPAYPSAEEWAKEFDFLDKFLLPLQSKLRSCSALFSALDLVENAVEITDSSKLVQFVNAAFEQSTGCQKAEIIGTASSELRRKSLPTDILCSTISSTQNLNGEVCHTDEKANWRCVQVPGPSNCAQMVHVKQIPAVNDSKDYTAIYRKNSCSERHNPVDIPMSEVLHTLREIEQKCAKNEDLQKLLHKLLKTLSSAELYAPVIRNFYADKVASDLFGGLVLNGPVPPISRLRKPSLSETMRLGINLPYADAVNSASPEVKALLQLEPTWNFDILELERLTLKRPLTVLAMKILQRCKVRDFLQCHESCLRAWLEVIESHYLIDNPYHNATHAADVLQATAYYLGKEKVAKSIDHQMAVGALLAAIVHDVGHPGKGTAFLINTRHQLAILYNDIAVLENHHVALTFQLTLGDQHINIFRRLNRQDYTNLRKTVVDLVLATDMNKHFEYLAKFHQLTTMTNEENGGDATNIIDKMEPQKIISRMLIKCADISNPTRPFELCKTWANRIIEEYFCQTAEERAKGLPLTMQVFDRDTCNIPLTQCSFIDMFVREMFNAWSNFGDMPELIRILEDNYQRWNDEGKQWQPRLNLKSTPTGESVKELRKGSEGSALKLLPTSRKLSEHRSDAARGAPKIHSSSPVLSGNVDVLLSD